MRIRNKLLKKKDKTKKNELNKLADNYIEGSGGGIIGMPDD